MSETTTEAAPEVADATEAAPVVDNAPVPTEEAGREQTDVGHEPSEEPKHRGDRRFAVLTAKHAYAEQRAEKAEKDLTDLKARLALLEAERGKPEVPEGHKPAPTADEVDALAEQKLQAREFEQRRLSVVSEGEKALGADGWKEKTDLLASFGAFGNPAFLPALIEVPNAAALVSELADDPARLQALLRKQPVAMAAELGRMSAELAAPKVKALSSAPAPVSPTKGRGTIPELTVADTDKMSMREWIEMRNKQAPSHLGGAKRRSTSR